MDIDNKNPSWEKMINLCAVLMSENEQYKNGWAMEMATQAKQNARRWFIAWVITLGALIGTNAAWIHAASGYEQAVTIMFPRTAKGKIITTQTSEEM